MQSLVREYVRMIESLRVGEALTISRHQLQEIAPRGLFGAMVDRRTPEEIIVDNVIGSAYRIRCHVDPMTGNVRFTHDPAPDGLRTHVESDRRHLFRERPDGLWERNECHSS